MTQPSNTKESSLDFFKKYSALLKESERDDPTQDDYYSWDKNNGERLSVGNLFSQPDHGERYMNGPDYDEDETSEDDEKIEEGFEDDFVSVAKKVQPTAKLAPQGGFVKPKSDLPPVKKEPVDYGVTGDPQKDFYSQPSDRPRNLGDSKINKGKMMSESKTTGTLYQPETAIDFNKLARGTAWTKLSESKFKSITNKGPLFVWESGSGKKYAVDFVSGTVLNEQNNKIAHSTVVAHPVLGKLIKADGNPIRAGLTESTRKTPSKNLFLEAYKKRGLMEGVSDRVLTKRKMIVSEARKLITLAESTKMPTAQRNMYIGEAQKAISLVKSGKLNEAQLDKIGEGIWGGLTGVGKLVGNQVAKTASNVGNKVAAGAKAVGTAVDNVATKAGNAVKSAANTVGQAYQQSSNAQDAKQAMGTLTQVSQFLAKAGMNVNDNITVGQLKQALQGMASGATP